MAVSIVEEIFSNIIRKNSSNRIDSIPHSDTFAKEIYSLMGIDEKSLHDVIQLLKDSHKILIMKIAKEDTNNNIPEVNGYVDADLTTLHRLKNIYQTVLEDTFEKEYGTRVGVHQVLRELFPRMQMLNNTPMGDLVNKAMMLEEFEKLIEKQYMEYTEQWKEKTLNRLVMERSDLLAKLIPEKPKVVEEPAKPRRAVDSDQFQDFEKAKSNQSLEKVLSIYGVDFFFRVSLRRYEFDSLRGLVLTKKIDRKEDLRKLKELLSKTKNNMQRDTRLQEFTENIHQLDRAISRAMHFSHH